MFVIPRKLKDSRLIFAHEYLKHANKDEEICYEPVDGEMIEVRNWFHYPSYDIIVGVPHKSSPRAEKEKAAMVFRYDNGKSYCTYLDLQELDDMLYALTTIRRKLQ